MFTPNVVCIVLFNISDGIFIPAPRSCPRGWTLGRWGAQGGIFSVFGHGHMVYQIDGDDEQNRMQEQFHPRVKLVTLG